MALLHDFLHHHADLKDYFLTVQHHSTYNTLLPASHVACLHAVSKWHSFCQTNYLAVQHNISRCNQHHKHLAVSGCICQQS